MPNSQDYQTYDIALMVGGLARHLSWRQIPPTHWFNCKRWVIHEESLVTASGYELFVPEILSPEYQEFLNVGAVYAVAANPATNASFFFIESEADLEQVVRTVREVGQVSTLTSGGGNLVTVTSTNHTISSGEEVLLVGTKYAGTYAAQNIVPGTSFDIDFGTPWDVDDTVPGTTLWYGDPMWEVKVEKDTDPNYIPLVNVAAVPASGYTILQSKVYYGGTRWLHGTTTEPLNPDHEKKRYMLRSLVPLVGSQPETCPVIKMYDFRESDGTHNLYVHTLRDVYLYDAIGLAMGPSERITPIYSQLITDGIKVGGPGIGTADFVALGTTVTGTGTLWATDEVPIDALIKANGDPESAWTRISSVGPAETAITLAEGYRGATSGGAVAYDIIWTYMSDALSVREARIHRWSVEQWRSGLPKDLYLAVNGHDRPQKHDGATAQMKYLAYDATAATAGFLDNIQEGGSPPVDCTSARVVKVFYESCCLAGTVEGGQLYPLRVRWSQPRNCEYFEAYKYRDLEGDDEIRGCEILSNTNVWFTDHAIHNQNFAPSPIDFSFVRKENEVGCKAPGSIKDTGDGYLRFIGPGDFYQYDLVKATKFGEPIRNMVFPLLDDEFLAMAEAHFDEQSGIYMCSIPLTSGEGLWDWITLAYDIRYKRWFEPTDAHMAYCTYFETQQFPVIDEYTDLINRYDDVFDQRAGFESPVILAGGRTGQIYKLETGYDRDRADMDTSVTFGFTDFNTPGMKRLGWLTMTHSEADFPIEIYVGLSMDGRRILRWIGPLSYSLATVSGEDREALITVDEAARWFVFRVDNLKRNQYAALETLTAFYRLEGRG